MYRMRHEAVYNGHMCTMDGFGRSRGRTRFTCGWVHVGHWQAPERKKEMNEAWSSCSRKALLEAPPLLACDRLPRRFFMHLPHYPH